MHLSVPQFPTIVTAMSDQEMICHQPFRFINGRQRCRRCGEILEVEEKTAIDTGVSWVCRNADGSVGESILPAAAFRPGQSKCEERPWLDEMGHKAGEPSGRHQPCARCGEDLAWLFFSEPLPVGAEVTVRFEGNPGEDVRHSGSMSVAAGTPLCVDRQNP